MLLSMLPPQLRSFLSSSLTLACLMPALLFWAGRLFGNQLRLLEAMTMLPVQFLWMSLLGSVIACCTRKNRRMFLSVAATGYLLFHVALWYLPRPQPDQASLPLRVISFNLLHQNQQVTETTEWILAQQPDVAVFQEATHLWPEALKALEGQLPYSLEVELLQMIIYSRYPIQKPEWTQSGRRRGFIRFQIDQPRHLTLYATHAYPVKSFGWEGFSWRKEHLQDLLPRDILEQPQQPIVVLGDLNASMWSPAYRNLIRKTGLYNARQGYGIQPSLSQVQDWHSWKAVAIDHCLHSRDVAVAHFQLGPFLGSDHLPLCVDLLLAPDTPSRP